MKKAILCVLMTAALIGSGWGQPADADGTSIVINNAQVVCIVIDAVIDMISYNLSNWNTPGFKQGCLEFEDLMGNGIEVGAIRRDFSQGLLQYTGADTDVAIAGEGFFRVRQRYDSFAYTRDGSFKVDTAGRLVTSNGLCVLPEIVVPEPETTDLGTLAIARDGRVTVKLAGADEPTEIGQIELYRFANQAGLEAAGDSLLGNSLFKVSNASGPALPGRPGAEGMGSLEHGFLEMSNVSVANEMEAMVAAQKTYEFYSLSVQTSGGKLSGTTNLVRVGGQ
jgi:flagellar basal-body rod protein FlgG